MMQRKWAEIARNVYDEDQWLKKQNDCLRVIPNKTQPIVYLAFFLAIRISVSVWVCAQLHPELAIRFGSISAHRKDEMVEEKRKRRREERRSCTFAKI